MKTKTGFATLPAATLLAICDGLQGDGHGFYDPAFLTELGVPQEMADSVTHEYTSDTSNYKATIFKDGKIVKKTVAVYSLSLYRTIADSLGLPGSDKFGRGSEARELDHQIREYLK